MNNTEQELEALYAKLPTIKCKGLCQECCGPIGMAEAEFRRIHSRVGDRVRPVSFGGHGVGLISKNLTCPLLKDGRCSVYEVRPMICRIWGMVPEMRCPHGCVPSRWMTKRETFRFLGAANNVKAVLLAALCLLCVAGCKSPVEWRAEVATDFPGAEITSLPDGNGNGQNYLIRKPNGEVWYFEGRAGKATSVLIFPAR